MRSAIVLVFLLVIGFLFISFREASRRTICLQKLSIAAWQARVWGRQHGDRLPTNLSCFAEVGSWIALPKEFFCPADSSKPQKADKWSRFDESKVSYQLVSPGIP